MVAPSAAGQPDRPHRLGHRPPGLRPQAADGPARPVRDAAPAGRRGWLPASLREPARRVRRRPRGDRPVHRRRGWRWPATCAARDERIAVVVGDAALMSGLSLEALNDIGQRGTRMLIVLNDNEMSISPTVGAMSQYLSRIKLSRTWRGSRRAYDDAVGRIPQRGPDRATSGRAACARAVVDFAQPGRLFEDLGITYIGPGARARPARRSSDPPACLPRTWTGRCWSTCGPARDAATGRPRPTRSASTARRCRP